jgi:hypothetical protein
MKRIASAIKTLFWVFAALHLQAFWAWGICTLFDNGFLIGLFLFVSFIANFVGCYLIDLFFLNKSKYKTFDNPALLGITALLHVPAMIFGQKNSRLSFLCLRPTHRYHRHNPKFIAKRLFF